MPDNDQPVSDIKQLRRVCRGILPPPVPEALVGQVARVLMAKLDATETAEIVDRASLVRAFASLRLLSPRLLFLFGKQPDAGGAKPLEPLEMPPVSQRMAELLQAARAELASAAAGNQPPCDRVALAGGLAVCFAASAYPQRVSQMINASLAWRVEAWLDEFLRLRRSGCTLPAVGRLPGTVPPGEFLSVLGAAAITCDAGDSALRSSGAALYLASCYQEEIDRIVELWRTEAPILNFFRKWLSSPPSWTVREDRSKRKSPDWGRVRSALAAYCPGETSALVDQAIILEQMVWNASRQYLEPDMLMQVVQEVWDQLWTKLTSGFPYYTFRSRFTWWWKQCLHHAFQRRRDRLIEPEKAEELSIVETRRELTPDMLRCVREGYRLVRTTFYGQRPQAGNAAPAGRGRKPPRSAAQVIRDNEKVREVLDAVWLHRIRCRVADYAGEQEMVQQIAGQFPQINPNTIDTYCRRLRLRLWAYQLARLERFSNAEILSSDPAAARARGDPRKVSWESVGAVPSIAALARAVLPDHTLLWAFAAHVYFHELVDPSHPDPWTFPRFLRELWYWVNDGTLEDAIRQGSLDGSAVDTTALHAIAGPHFKEVLCALQECEDVHQVDERIREAKAAGRCATCKAQASTVLEDFAGAAVFGACDKTAFKKWKAVVGGNNGHWIIPVWYLTVIEQVDEKQVRLRCQPATEAGGLDALGRAVAARLRPPAKPAG
jgi:hypothetical protein